MRSYYPLLLFLLLLGFSSQAQEKRVLGGPVSIKDLQQDSTQVPFVAAQPQDDEDALVSGRAYTSIVGDRFSYLVTGDKDLATLGNFASINVLTATANVAFGGILHGKKKTV